MTEGWGMMEKPQAVLFVLVIIVMSFTAGYAFRESGTYFNELIKTDFFVGLNGVPQNLLGGCNPDEKHGVICGYIEGKKDATSGKEPVSYYFPESTHYGYCHGYADYSDIDYKTIRKMSVENAMLIYK